MSLPADAKRLLTSEPLMAHLATSVDKRPHVAPVWYVYDVDKGVVELVTTGKKLENVRENSRVALSVEKSDSGDPEWAVTVLGTATVVDDEAENRGARRRINAKYGESPDAYAGNTLVRIDIGSGTYRTY
ncbi:pyridoxamine 5'-phosphate oxidase family protein [Natrialbaceae archaeon A-gly3]